MIRWNIFFCQKKFSNVVKPRSLGDRLNRCQYLINATNWKIEYQRNSDDDLWIVKKRFFQYIKVNQCWSLLMFFLVTFIDLLQKISNKTRISSSPWLMRTFFFVFCFIQIEFNIDVKREYLPSINSNSSLSWFPSSSLLINRNFQCLTSSQIEKETFFFSLIWLRRK